MNERLEKDFIIEYFKEMRAEINLRIRIHTNYVAAKIVSCGAIISFLLTNQIAPDLKLLSLPLAPVISMLYDVMIAKNIRIIQKIGIFIRDKLETQMQELELWETYAGQKEPKVRGYGYTDIVFHSFFTLGTLIIPMILHYLQKDMFPVTLRYALVATYIVLFVCITFVFWFMQKCILHFNPPKDH